MVNEEVVLQRDCRVTLIPAGDEMVLPAGRELTVTQALGGSVTLRDGMGLYRVDAREVDALGEDLAAAFRAQEAAEAAAAAGGEEGFSEERVWDALKACFDPEIPVNIVDLGLIYDLAVNAAEDGGHEVSVKMTLTAQGCGMGPKIAGDAQARIEALPTVRRAAVDIVWDPQWTPHMISPEGRRALGLE